MNTLLKTNYNFPGQTDVYHGKVRDVYSIGNDTLVTMYRPGIRRSTWYCRKGYPYKGQVLNQIHLEVPGRHRRHRPQLETGITRPDGYRGYPLRTV